MQKNKKIILKSNQQLNFMQGQLEGKTKYKIKIKV